MLDFTKLSVSRRSLFFGACAAGLATMLWMATASHAAQNAGQFLEDIGDRAIALLSNTAEPEAKREEKFMEMLKTEFDMPRISRFIIGRYWRSASKEEQDAFIDVFARVMAKRFVPLFSGAKKDQFAVDDVRDDKDPSIKFVHLRVQTTSGKPANTIWRVAETDNQFKILDVVVEGASMAITLRSEYGGVLKQNGGKLAQLTDQLRQKVN